MLRACLACRKDRDTLEERAKIEEEVRAVPRGIPALTLIALSVPQEIAIETEKQQRQIERKKESTRLVVEEVRSLPWLAVRVRSLD